MRACFFKTFIVWTVILLPSAAFCKDKPDPLVGKWQLNMVKTHYGGRAQKRTQESFTCTPQKNGVTCTIYSTREDGSRVTASFTAGYDGVAAPVKGLNEVDEVRLERESDSTASATFSYQGSYVFAYRSMRSSDGKTLTVVAVDPVTRRRLRSVVVYDLVPEK